jgi:NAD(P)H-flavin reductase
MMRYHLKLTTRFFKGVMAPFVKGLYAASEAGEFSLMIALFDAKITKNKKIAKDFYELSMEWQGEPPKPGRFVTILLSSPESYLRRPFAFSGYDAGKASIIYKVVGPGTEILSRTKRGKQSTS